MGKSRVFGESEQVAEAVQGEHMLLSACCEHLGKPGTLQQHTRTLVFLNIHGLLWTSWG